MFPSTQPAFAQESSITGRDRKSSATPSPESSGIPYLRTSNQNLRRLSSLSFDVDSSVVGTVVTSGDAPLPQSDRQPESPARRSPLRNESWRSSIVLASPDRFASTTERGGRTVKTTALGTEMYMQSGDGKYIKDRLPPTPRERVRILLSRGATALSVVATNIFSGEDWATSAFAASHEVRVSGYTRVDGVYCAIVEFSPLKRGEESASESGGDAVLTRVFIGDADKLPRRIEQEVTRAGYKMTQTETFRNYKTNAVYPKSYFVTAPPAGATVITPIRSPRAYSNIRVGNSAPDFAVRGANGQPVSLGSLRGKYVLLQFWGTWCQPCQQDWGTIKEWKQRPVGQKIVPISIGLDPLTGIVASKAKAKQGGVTWLSTVSGKGWADPIAQYNLT